MVEAPPFDPCDVLGVSHDADPATVDAAWRAALFEVHPDRHPEADAAERARLEAATRSLNAARDELRTRRRRPDPAAWRPDADARQWRPRDAWTWEQQGMPHAARPSWPDPDGPGWSTQQEPLPRVRVLPVRNDSLPSVGTTLIHAAWYLTGLYWAFLLAVRYPDGLRGVIESLAGVLGP